MTTQISLARILELGVARSWHEAVAVSQHVGREARMAATSAGLDNCLLSTSGVITLVGRSRTPFVGEATGATLRALLDRTQAPRELLAIVDRAEEPTLEDISEQLEFFARPDAAELAGAVAARALAAEADARQHAAIEQLRAEASTPKPAEKKASGSSRRLAPWALGGLAVLGVAAAALGFAARPSAIGSPTPTATEIAPTADAAVGPVQSPVERITGQLDSLVDKGLTALGLAPAAPMPPTADTVKPPDAGSPKLVRRSPLPKGTAPLVVIMPPAVEPTPVPTVTVIDVTDSPVERDVVDDNSAVDFQPPVLRWPQLPNEPESLPVEAGTPHLELFINERGTVDKVRLRTMHTSYHERMLVAAAKAWVFHPALKEGQPVSYLMKVPIVLQ